MKSNTQITHHNLKAARPGWLTAAGSVLTVGVYLQLGACGANGGSSATSGTTATNSNTATTSTTTATATCDVSVQPACPSTSPSYSGEIENIIATYCLQCHDPNGVGAAATTTTGVGNPGGAPGDANRVTDPNAMLNPNFTQNPNFTNSNPNRWDPSDAHDWSKYANIHMNATLIEQQVFLCDMPPNGATPLSAADRQTLLNWLACNAPNN